MHRATWVWLCLTILVGAAALAIARQVGNQRLPFGLMVGVVVSAITFVAGKISLALCPVGLDAYPRLLVESAVRFVIPMVVVAVIAIYRRDLLDKVFLAYFLPFQFITLIADTLGAIRRVRDEV